MGWDLICNNISKALNQHITWLDFNSLQSSLNSLGDCSPNKTNASNFPDGSVSNPKDILKNIRIKNLNRLIIAQLNINSIRNKFEPLQELIKENIDILVITESKIDSSFPFNQFEIEGYSQFRLDKSSTSGGVIIYVREDIPCRELKDDQIGKNIQGIFLEINLRKSKWLLFGGYNNDKSNIDIFLGNLGPILDKYMCKFENFILLGDVNSEMLEVSIWTTFVKYTI